MSALRQEGTKCQNIWNGLNKCVRSKNRITTAVRIDLGTIERTIECGDKEISGAKTMFAWLKKLFAERDRHPKKTERGTITRTCKICGKTFTLPENVQSWPDCCQECRAKYRPAETITRKCRKCGKTFTFPSNARHWPKYCRECRQRRSSRGKVI